MEKDFSMLSLEHLTKLNRGGSLETIYRPKSVVVGLELQKYGIDLKERIKTTDWSDIYRAWDKKGGEICVKVVNQMQFFYKEKQALDKVAKSRFIISLFQSIETKRFGMFIVPFARGETLLEFVEKEDQLLDSEETYVLNLDNIRVIIYRLLRALAYIHELSVIHRDVKFDNVLFLEVGRPDTIVLADFGLSYVLDKGQCNVIGDRAGTPEYAAPELLEKSVTSCATDMWAFGVILYALIFREAPFFGETMEEIFAEVLDKIHLRNIWINTFRNDVPRNPGNLIRNILVRDPEKRLTAKQCLKHMWFQNKTV
jgi:serine/threonine protein kinase